MTEEEYLQIRSHSRLYRQLFIVFTLIQVGFFLFLTSDGVLEMTSFAKWILFVAQIYCANHMLKTRTHRYQKYHKARELRVYQARDGA